MNILAKFAAFFGLSTYSDSMHRKLPPDFPQFSHRSKGKYGDADPSLWAKKHRTTRPPWPCRTYGT